MSEQGRDPLAFRGLIRRVCIGEVLSAITAIGKEQQGGTKRVGCLSDLLVRTSAVYTVYITSSTLSFFTFLLSFLSLTMTFAVVMSQPLEHVSNAAPGPVTIGSIFDRCSRAGLRRGSRCLSEGELRWLGCPDMTRDGP